MWRTWFQQKKPVEAPPDRAWRWLPSHCAICHSWPHAPLCDACISRFAPPLHRCTRCALPLAKPAQQCGPCLKSPPPWDLCLTATAYKWPWNELIAEFKFHPKPGWAGSLATLMWSATGTEDALAAADWVLPMPLSVQRLTERGFNQALLLARQLSPHKTDPYLLLRTRHTAAQHTLPRAQRLSNLASAFAVDPLRAHDVRGKRVVLLDDVMTSGATFNAAAQALRQAGAAHICALSLARTESGQED